MHDPMVVQKLNGAGDADEAPGRVFRIERARARAAGQTCSVDEIHRKIMLPVDLADFVDADDLRMPQAAGRPSFAVKALHVVHGRQMVRQNHLERHDAVKIALPRSVDDSHPAAADFFEQFVFTEVSSQRLSAVARGGFARRAGHDDGHREIGRSGPRSAGGIRPVGVPLRELIERLEALRHFAPLGIRFEPSSTLGGVTGMQCGDVPIEQIEHPLVVDLICSVRHL